MIGQTLGHYCVLEQIGAGGMGLVFRAHDERLDRDVALKVLPPGTLGDENARKRFRKEALTLSKLNHPNIETVFDFDTQDGVDFLVMELIPGTTLDQKLLSGALPEKEVLRLGQQLAEGLAAAHAQGVIHRDLKPGNISITSDGRLKILDFGLAKLLQPASETAITESMSETHGPVGTLPYMAPEQLRGEKADARSDLWAAGTVLYEMATGRRPFDAKVSTALAGDIQHKPPPPPRQLKSELSLRLEDLILKCLEKDPADRSQSAKELLVDLRRLADFVATGICEPEVRARRRWVTGLAVGVALVVIVAALVTMNVGGLRDRLRGPAPPPPIQSLAVLPLRNLSGNPAEEYVVEGMHEALITELARIRALRVISRTSVMRYQGTDKPLAEIARELEVDAVVEGSLLRSGNRVRVTAQLIRATPERHLWADSFDRDFTDVLVLTSEVARAIAAKVEISLTPQEQALLGRARPVTPEAYEAYLKGRYHAARFTPEDLQKSIRYFEQALEKDGSYAPAYAGLADVYITIAFGSVFSSKELHKKAKDAAARALKIDDTLAEAHSAMGWTQMVSEWAWSEAESEFQQALELNPGSADSHQRYSVFLSAVGRHQDAIAEAKAAWQLNPLSPLATTNVGWRYQDARQNDRAVEWFLKALELDANYFAARQNLARVYLLQGNRKEALAEVEKLKPVVEANPSALPFLAELYAAAGQRAEAQRALEQVNRLPRQMHVANYGIALAHAHLGNRDLAFAELEKAFEERDSWLIFLKSPMLDPLRSDPRFQALLRRMNFPP